MTEDKKLIKFLSIPSKRTVKDFIGSICRQLNFTRTNYKEINGIFVEKLQNNRFHLHIFSRSDEIKEGLQNIGKSTSDPNYLSIEINKINHLFVMPPFNNSVYRVLPMERNCEFFEKVIEFTTGINQTIMDVLLLIDTNKYKILYLVCNRAKTFIAFQNGTDAMEMMELLRSQHFSPKFASCYAKLLYVEESNQPRQQIVPPPVLPRPNNNNLLHAHQRQIDVAPRNAVRANNNVLRRDYYNRRRDNNAIRQRNMRQQNNVVPQFNNVQMVPNHIFPRHNPNFQFPIRRNVIQHQNNRINNNMQGARFIRVMFPDNIQNNQYEMRLVRRF